MTTFKKAFIAAKIISLTFTGIVLAAQEDESIASASQQPYVTATQSGVIEFTETGKAVIVQDNFLVAHYAPVQSAAPAIQAVRGATLAVAREMFVTSTGYNSEEAQTDSTPFIAADGSRVYWGMVAANFLPFGTEIRIPDYYGDKVFVVHDRMARRFSDRVDVWFEHKPDAINWGRRTVRIEVLGS
ncbi:MAG: hypothetical protein AAB483_01955 [Patescibacteria group bacterium]